MFFPCNSLKKPTAGGEPTTGGGGPGVQKVRGGNKTKYYFTSTNLSSLKLTLGIKFGNSSFFFPVCTPSKFALIKYFLPKFAVCNERGKVVLLRPKSLKIGALRLNKRIL